MKRPSLIRAMLADPDRWEQGLEVGAALSGIEPPPAELVRAVVAEVGCGGTARRLAFALCAIWIAAAREGRLQPELRYLILGWTEGLRRELDTVPTRRYGYSHWWGSLLQCRGRWKAYPKRPMQRLLLAQAGAPGVARQWIEALTLAGLDRTVKAHRAQLVTALSRLLVAERLPVPVAPPRSDEAEAVRIELRRPTESIAAVHAQLDLLQEAS